MADRIAGFAAHSNQTLQFQHPRSRAFLPQINSLLVVQGRLILFALMVLCLVAGLGMAALSAALQLFL